MAEDDGWNWNIGSHNMMAGSPCPWLMMVCNHDSWKLEEQQVSLSWCMALFGWNTGSPMMYGGLLNTDIGQ